MLTFLLGGARSGKSSLAVELATRRGGPVTYVATSPTIAGDEDLATRIEHHRAERPTDWATIEEELDLAGAVSSIDPGATVIIDCLTTWLGNQFHVGNDSQVTGASGDALIAIGGRSGLTVAISNEVGLGIVPADAMSRAYRDELGRVNQAWAAAADTALLLVAGQCIPLRDPWEFLS